MSDDPPRGGEPVILGMLAGALCGAAAVLLGVAGVKTYGIAVFVATPFLIGVASTAVLVRLGPTTKWGAVRTAWLAVLLLSGGFFALGKEGLLCIGMALPLALPCAAFAALLAQFYLGGSRDRKSSTMTLGMIMGVLPLAIVVEPALLSDPSPFVVHTSIEISAPPAAVWRHLVAFDAIPAPAEWMFRAGIAYPISATLAGRGVGAIRSCQFSTGVFVEPIELWEEGRRLKFSVAATPPPLREWSPYRHVHPLHLDGYFVPRSADFQLTALEIGRTRLAATSVYGNRMRPRAYWGLWSDAIVHRVHARVFEQIKRLAERDAGANSP